MESRTKNVLAHFDGNMAGIFDRASFYESDLYSTKDSTPGLSRTQMCLKWTLLLSNLIFLIFGIVLMSVGSYAMSNQLGPVTGTTLPSGLIVLGVFIMLLSFVGAFAAWKELRILLAIYFIVLMMLTIILFAVSIAVYVQRSKASMYLTEAWPFINNDTRQTIYNSFSCCGLTQYPADNPDFCPPSSRPNKTCLSTIDSAFQSSVMAAGGSGIAFSVIMMVGMAFVYMLMRAIRRKRLEQDLAALRESNNPEEGNEQSRVSSA